jgi:ATP-dependent DNA helicase RecG
MLLADLKTMTSQGESGHLEFKATTGQRSEGAKAVCAMLNGRGGHVRFGVTDGGEVRGQVLTAHTQEEVDRELRRIEPQAFPSMEAVPVPGQRTVLVLKVPPNAHGPFTFDGRPCLRQGPQTLVMPRGRYEELRLERLHATHRWENQPVPEGVGLQDLDHEDNRRYWGNAFRLLRRAESFLMDPTPIASRVLPRMEREDRPVYLPAVTREGLANALCHRDYTQASGAISVARYDDRLAIVSPGGLPFGLTSASLSTPHESKPWNPLIAAVFYRAGIIESWGSGMTRMLEACQDQHRPSPSWSNEISGLRLVLAAPPVTPEVMVLLDQCWDRRTRQELQITLGLKDIKHFREAYLHPALEAGFLAMSIPGKPNTRLQQYVLTPNGSAILKTISRPGPSKASPRESEP